MTAGLNRTRRGIARGSSMPTAPNMPCGAAEHADVQMNSYVTATRHIRTAWANARLLSLAKFKQHIMRETHEPVTLEASWWSNMESISQCIATYHHAIGASEHDSCRAIQHDICAYAYALRRCLSNVNMTEFFELLHRASTTLW